MIDLHGPLPPWPVCCREPLIRQAWWHKTPTGVLECCRLCEACHEYRVLRWVAGKESQAILVEMGLWDGRPPSRFQEKGEQRGGKVSIDKQLSLFEGES